MFLTEEPEHLKYYTATVTAIATCGLAAAAVGAKVHMDGVVSPLPGAPRANLAPRFKLVFYGPWPKSLASLCSPLPPLTPPRVVP